MNIQQFSSTGTGYSSATAVLIGEDVHVLRSSRSRYGLTVHGHRRTYVCQDGCCDGGLRSDVQSLVEQAKAAGAKRVILRTGLRNNYVGKIADLPVVDVSGCVGTVCEGVSVNSTY